MIVAEIVSVLILITTTGVGAYVTNFFRSKKKEVEENTKDIDCIKRSIVMMAKRVDRGTVRSHPGVESNIEDLVRDLLTDDIVDNE